MDPTICAKVGPKQRHVKVPNGWYRVIVGKCVKGDQFCRTVDTKFQFVEEDDIGIDATDFDMLIRKKLPHQQ